MTAAAQGELLRAWQQRHDGHARATLIAASEGLAWYAARPYANCGADWEDLLGEARLAMLEACDSYEPAIAGWTTHACHCMRRALRRFVRRALAHGNCLPLSMPLFADGETTLLDTLGVDATQEEATATREQARRARRLVLRVTRHNPRWRLVANLRLLSARPLSGPEVGERLGCTRACVALLTHEVIKRARRAAGQARR